MTNRPDDIGRRLASGAFWATFVRFAAILAGLGMNAMLARLLVPDDMGMLFLLMSTMMIISVPAQLGFDRVAVRSTARAAARDDWSRVISTVRSVIMMGGLGASIAGVLVLLLGRPVIRELTGYDFEWPLVFLLVFWIIAHTLASLVQEIFRGLSDIRMSALVGMLLPPLSSLLLLLGLSLRYDALTLESAMAAVIGGALTALILGAAVLLARLGRPLLSPGQESGGTAVPWALVINGFVFVLLQRSDIWLLGYFRPPDEVAIYGAAARLYMLVGIPVQLIGAAVPPLIAELHARGDDDRLRWLLRKSAGLYAIPSSLVLIMFALFGGTILELIYGAYYREGHLVLVILALGQVIGVWCGNGVNLMMMLQADRPLLQVTVVSLLTAAAIAVSLAPDHGALGVAIGFGLAFALRGTLSAAYCWVRLGFNTLPSFTLNFVSAWRSLRRLRRDVAPASRRPSDGERS